MTDDTCTETNPEFSELLSALESLRKERDVLREDLERQRLQNEEFRAKLLDATMASNNYLRELEKLQKDLNRLRSPPHFVASVTEILAEEGKVILRQHGSNQEAVVSVTEELLENLKPNTRVAVNSALSIIQVLESAADVRARVMELEEAPEIDYDEIGGLEDQIREVMETVELPLTQPEIFEEVGIDPPKGVLLYGPPGTGKTLLAKAVAHRANATFLKMAGSELVHKFIGEGSQLVRDMFKMAREKAPTIVFIDEIDAVASHRVSDGTSGGAEVQRTMMQLLSELDGFGDRGDVRVIAATNRLDMLDIALLRPGRFDRIIEVPLPDKNGREQIFRIHTRKMNLSKDIDFRLLADMTDDSSGADIKAIATEAGMFAIRAGRKQVEETDFVDAYDKVMKKKETVNSSPQGMFV